MLQIIENRRSTSISFFCIIPHYYAIIKNIYYPMIRNTIFQVHNCTQPSLALGLAIWTYKENNARFSCNIQPRRCITYRYMILICYIRKQSISIYDIIKILISHIFLMHSFSLIVFNHVIQIWDMLSRVYIILIINWQYI